MEPVGFRDLTFYIWQMCEGYRVGRYLDILLLQCQKQTDLLCGEEGKLHISSLISVKAIK